MAISYFMQPLCAYLGISFQIITHYIGLFLAPIMYLFISSIVFKFCWYHRLFIWYIMLVEGLNITDWYFVIPINDEDMCKIHFIITLLFLLGIVVYYIKKKIPSRA